MFLKGLNETRITPIIHPLYHGFSTNKKDFRAIFFEEDTSPATRRWYLFNPPCLCCRRGAVPQRCVPVVFVEWFDGASGGPPGAAGRRRRRPAETNASPGQGRK